MITNTDDQHSCQSQTWHSVEDVETSRFPGLKTASLAYLFSEPQARGPVSRTKAKQLLRNETQGLPLLSTCTFRETHTDSKTKVNDQSQPMEMKSLSNKD